MKVIVLQNVVNFYIDDSGTRHPSKKVGNQAAHGYDWFAFGGVLVEDDDESSVREMHSAFCEKWNIEAPLHSSEIRSQNENFFWIRSLSNGKRAEFYEELYLLMRDAPLIGLACVVDRPGYNNRYSEMYNAEPWMLCKTAFCVAVERAVKYANSSGKRLRVLPERCNKREDNLVRRYYLDLKEHGMPFDTGNSEKYAPLSNGELAHALYELKIKNKSSPIMQLADLFLWPICMGGYHKENRPYRRLKEDGKLIECHIDSSDMATMASKYSCFEGVEVKS